MKKNILFSVGFVLLTGVLYAAFKESGLQTNTQTQIKIYEKDHPNLGSIERALGMIEKVDYAAIVYIQETTLHGDSWFGRNIFGPEHWHASSKAKVLYTIMGEEHPTILYEALSGYMPNHAVFVALCDIDGLYEPDVGYAIPATEELIAYIKERKKFTPVKNSASTCEGQGYEDE